VEMSPNEAIVLFQRALLMALLMAGPMLIFGLVAGVAVSIFQAVTQIQEMTLTFIPKILAVVAALFLFMPWMLNQMLRYTVETYGRIPLLQ
jgi:flagellar biosynthesis protein FliQ